MSWLAALGAAGLTREAKIVFYDDTLTSWGSAGRFFWMLEYLGCTAAQVLNGGWDKWAADELPTETTENTLASTQFVPQVNTAIFADKEHIAQRMEDDDFVTIDHTLR